MTLNLVTRHKKVNDFHLYKYFGQQIENMYLMPLVQKFVLLLGGQLVDGERTHCDEGDINTAKRGESVLKVIPLFCSQLPFNCLTQRRCEEYSYRSALLRSSTSLPPA